MDSMLSPNSKYDITKWVKPTLCGYTLLYVVTLLANYLLAYILAKTDLINIQVQRFLMLWYDFEYEYVFV